MTPEFNHEMERHDIFIDEEPKFQQMEIEISSSEKILNFTSSDTDSVKINPSQIIKQKNIDPIAKKLKKKQSNITIEEEHTNKNDNRKIVENSLDRNPIETDQKNDDSLFEANETFIENQKTLMKVKILSKFVYCYEF